MIKKERVVVAMSGGVDSSVAAALLKKQGYEVIGITMCFGLQGIEDARRVAYKLDIKHYTLNMQRVLNERVIKNFCREYQLGRTPNPCVRCNQYIKFDALLKKVLSLGAKYLATGHYARIKKASSYLLRKARDLKKDQSYFLYRLGQKQLRHILFPLGNYTKNQVRRLAKEFQLSTAQKPGSQEICFIPHMDYREFLKQRGVKIKSGSIIDMQGNVLGEHHGIAFYTVGQRQGLGIAKGYPLYVTKIEPKNNKIIVGTKEEAKKREFLIKDVHFISKSIKKKVALKVKIRYNHKEMPAEVIPLAKRIKIRFKNLEFAITCGQSAVFYNRNTIVGGGIIERVLN